MNTKLHAIVITILSFLFCNTSYAQSGSVYSLTGLGTTIADGLPAITSNVNSAGMVADGVGNIYLTDNTNSKVRLINPGTGIITTVAGTTPGFTGDGGPSTLAKLDNIAGICLDALGNIFVADGSNSRIRKINAITGIITTVAGGGSSAAEGVPATAAQIMPMAVCVDALGNIYTGDVAWFTGANRIRKIDHTTGLITTFAGGGTGGDGVPATDAHLDGAPTSLCFDVAGNMYVADTAGRRVRKIDAATHIITTIAGGGSLTTDGVPATNEKFTSMTGCAVDAIGNLFIADYAHSVIKRVPASTGIISTICGGGLLTTEGAPASSSQINPTWVYANLADGNIYFDKALNGNIRKFSFAPLAGSGTSSVTDSFMVELNHQCNGPEISILTRNYIAGRSVKTYYGDGATDSSTLTPGFLIGAYAIIHHSYPASGTYTIRHILYMGGVAVDSIIYSYTYTFCRTLPVKIFYDENGNCIKESTEPYGILPQLIKIDSNGTAVDTISVTSGLYYNAYCNAGDVYKFQSITSYPGLSTTCPAAGYLLDTIQTDTSNNIDRYLGMHCASATSFDLAINTVISVTGTGDQVGAIIVRNNSCLPEDGVVTLNFSPKYQYYTGHGHPIPSSTTATSATWNITGLVPYMTTPFVIDYALVYNVTTGHLTVGDTVQTHVKISPTTGDIDTSNNYNIIIDTVRASCDPNRIAVSPQGCLRSGTTPNLLTYSINFENTGTDTAHNIYVLDTLPANVDPRSLRLLSASNAMFIDIRNHGSYYVVKFDFPGINLLDSTHHDYCDGSVIFTVNTLTGLATGDNINNRAGIYFDYNSVVMTNTATNTIGCPRIIEVPQIQTKGTISIYPNPTTGLLTIKTPKDDFTSLAITNSIGQLLLTEPITNTQTTINVNTLAPGLYYLTLKGESGVEVRKLVKV